MASIRKAEDELGEMAEPDLPTTARGSQEASNGTRRTALPTVLPPPPPPLPVYLLGNGQDSPTQAPDPIVLSTHAQMQQHAKKMADTMRLFRQQYGSQLRPPDFTAWSPPSVLQPDVTQK